MAWSSMEWRVILSEKATQLATSMVWEWLGIVWNVIGIAWNAMNPVEHRIKSRAIGTVGKSRNGSEQHGISRNTYKEQHHWYPQGSGNEPRIARITAWVGEYEFGPHFSLKVVPEMAAHFTCYLRVVRNTLLVHREGCSKNTPIRQSKFRPSWLYHFCYLSDYPINRSAHIYIYIVTRDIRKHI